MSDADANAAGPSPLSLERLRSAFARMLGDGGDDPASDSTLRIVPDPDVVTPEGIVEALLFVGRGDGGRLTAEEMAESIRDVSPDEVHDIVERLGEAYQRTGSALRVDASDDGYRVVLAEGMERMADQLRGRVRSSRLTPAALETLAIVAYRQPMDADAVEALRGQKCGSTLEQLVRRGLVRCDPPSGAEGKPQYATTDRFLRSLDLADIGQLPRVDELDD
ncbi:MAG: SMC-Scp complex subunit ScpB [Planctomycetota bacterium]